MVIIIELSELLSALLTISIHIFLNIDIVSYRAAPQTGSQAPIPPKFQHLLLEIVSLGDRGFSHKHALAHSYTHAHTHTRARTPAERDSTKKNAEEQHKEDPLRRMGCRGRGVISLSPIGGFAALRCVGSLLWCTCIYASYLRRIGLLANFKTRSRTAAAAPVHTYLARWRSFR